MNDKLPRGILKATPDSFVVQELVGQPARPVLLCSQSSIKGRDGKSPITVFSLTKRGWSTEPAIQEVARQLGVSSSSVSFHGLKDRHAHTSQLIGVKGEFGPAFSHRQIFLNQLYGRDFPLFHSGHKGNRFAIHIISAARSLKVETARSVPNFFGVQRFGRPGSENAGRLLLEGDYDRAADVILETPSGASLAQLIRQTNSAKAAFLHPSFGFVFKFEVVKWQSFLWNQLLREELGKDCPDRLPMWNPNEEVYELYRHLWNPQKLNQEALARIHRFNRPTAIKPRNSRAERSLIGWRLEFDLPPGAYATVVLSNLFDLEEKHMDSCG